MSSIDNEMKTALETVARAKIQEALGGDVIAKIVNEVINHKSTSSFGSRNSGKTFLEIVVFDCIEVMVRRIVQEELTNNAEIQAKMSAAIKLHSDKLVTSIIDGLLSDDWRSTFNLYVERKDDDR